MYILVLVLLLSWCVLCCDALCCCRDGLVVVLLGCYGVDENYDERGREVDAKLNLGGGHVRNRV